MGAGDKHRLPYAGQQLLGALVEQTVARRPATVGVEHEQLAVSSCDVRSHLGRRTLLENGDDSATDDRNVLAAARRVVDNVEYGERYTTATGEIGGERHSDPRMAAVTNREDGIQLLGHSPTFGSTRGSVPV